MAKGRVRTFGEPFVMVPNRTAKAPEIKNNENPISLEALGLIVNLLHYADGWELHKTEIYKRFAFNKETSVKKAWKELIKAGYMVEYKYRVGKKWEYEYIYNIVPYTEEQRAIIWEEAVEEHGKVWGLDFQDLKMKSSNCGPQNQEISNIKETKNELKKNKLNKNNNFVNKENESHLENSLKDTKTDYDGKTPYGDFIINVANEFYAEFAPSRWSKKQWQTIAFRIADEITCDSTTVIKNHRAYIYKWLENVAYKHDLKNGKVDFEKKLENSKVPFYNWLEN
jgi:hypothetical protein